MAAVDQNDRLRAGTLPDDPFADVRPVEPNTEARKVVARLSGPDPNDVQAEATLLGTLLWCGANAAGALSVSTVIDLVPTPDVMSSAQHAAVFAAILRVTEAGKPVDTVTVHAELVRERASVAFDVLERLVSLAEEPSVARVRAYAQSIRDAWLRRRALVVSKDIARACSEGKAGAGEIVAAALEWLKPIGDAVRGDASVSSLKANAIEVARDLASGRKVEYWPTGFRDLDLILGGLYPRETTVIAARTSVGKTAFATQISEHVVCSNEKTAVLYVTLEMPAKSFVRRLIASRSRVDGRSLRRNVVADSCMSRVHTAALELSKLPIFFAQSQSQTILSIHAMAQSTARSLAATGERLVTIVIDHIGLVKPSDKAHARSRHEQVAETSRGLRFLAEQHGCHVLGLCQIKRAADDRKGEDRMPGNSDLKESSAIEDDADNVVIIHRPRNDQKQFIEGPAWVNVSKGRNDGTGLFRLAFEPAYTRFRDWIE